ncbi:hypothetical protein C3L33_01754, partial [Rhododendron williamsianum]
MPESGPTRRSKTISCSTTFLLSLLVPVLAGIILYRLDSFDPAPLPTHEFSSQPVFVPLQNPRLLEGAERVGVGELWGPEDLAYDPKLGVIYTGCDDGWIKRLNLGCKRISKFITRGKLSCLCKFLQGTTFSFDLAQRYPFIRKVMAIMEKYTGKPHFQKYSGVLAVDLEGQPHAHYYDPALSLITGGTKIGDHLYCGSLLEPYIIRLNLTQHPAVSNVVMRS